jgi:hypothetical protein
MLHGGTFGRVARLLATVGLFTTTTPAVAQTPGIPPDGQVASEYRHATDAPLARAVRTTQPPVIDGHPDEAVWMAASPATELWQLTPDEGQIGSQRTDVRFLYDSDNLYVGAWLWDDGPPTTHPARRDASIPQSDRFAVYFDTHHDHRTAFRFLTNPSSLKKDEIVVGERRGPSGRSDLSWDPVWEVRSSVTEDGWFVEMRIPFSQLRYGEEDVQHWGLQVERLVRRLNEETYWSFTPRRERGGMARIGHLEGIEGIGRGRSLELLPYVSGSAEYAQLIRPVGALFDNPFRRGSHYVGNSGIDLKYRLTSDFTLAGTINPDFGQVELDPAVINLTAFETRFEEQRPFFVEGAEIFRVGEAGARAGPKTPQLLYTRRIGRAPQGEAPDSAVYSEVPVATTILGAMKITGKTANGWSLGALNVLARREKAPFVGQTGTRDEAIVEPLSNYFAGRVRRDLREGTASVGFIGTAVHRELNEPALRSSLRAAAYTVGVDGRFEWGNRTWLLSSTVSPSYTTGDPRAIDRAQRSSARYLQRPDAEHLEYDPTATSLSGLFGHADLSKGAGAWQGRLAVTAITPRYEANDLGFQTAADRIYVDLDVGYEQTRPGRYLRRWDVSVLPSATWNFASDPQALNLGISGTGQLLGFHTFSWKVERQFSAWDDRLTRGGPMARVPGGYSANSGGRTSFDGPLQLRLNTSLAHDEAGGWARGAGLTLLIRPGEKYDLQLGPQLSRSRTAAHYVTSVADPLADQTFGRRYVFAPLDQTTLSFQTRFSATFSQGLTFELYVQPLLSTGDYGELLELVAPRTFDFRRYSEIGTILRAGFDGYVVDPDGVGPAAEFQAKDLSFNSRSLIGNAVLRWEWRPGSTLFLVWQQSRVERLTPGFGGAALGRTSGFALNDDVRALFGLKPNNIFLIKVNYWLNP